MNIIRENDGSRVEAVFSSKQVAKLVTMAGNEYIFDMVQEYMSLVAMTNSDDGVLMRSVAAIGSIISDMVSVLRPEYEDKLSSSCKVSISKEEWDKFKWR